MKKNIGLIICCLHIILSPLIAKEKPMVSDYGNPVWLDKSSVAMPGNYLNKMNHYDFSSLWANFYHNKNIVGIIGDRHKRIKIKLLSVNKSSKNPNEYFVQGKSNVGGNICDFKGKIVLHKILKNRKLTYGVDDCYADKGLISQGAIYCTYKFKENKSQKYSGVFKGSISSFWYLDRDNVIKYDDINIDSDGFNNNLFNGTWKGYAKGSRIKKCNWGDYRIPGADKYFDLGSGGFHPNEEYGDNGWEIYRQAYNHGCQEAKKKEQEKWWQ